MPDIEEMVMARSHIEEMVERLEKYQNNGLLRGNLLDSEDFIEDTRVSLQTALKVLEKRVGFHIEKQGD